MSIRGAATCDNRGMRKSVRRVLGLGALAGASYAVWRAFERRRVAAGSDTAMTWEPQPFPYPPQPTTASEPEATPEPAPEPGAGPVTGTGPAWIDALDDGGCPVSHPVKAKLASGIFHLEGGANYPRTRADRCYTSAEAAEVDGLRAAKR
jgi:hypothetical protein